MKKIISLFIPLAVGFLSYFLTRSNMNLYSTIQKPFLAPPSIVFMVVWVILYVLMGIALYLVVSKPKDEVTIDAYVSFGLQLFFNFIWSLLFFNGRLFLISFVWLVMLWLLILDTILVFSKKSKIASYLLIPYLVWVTFAGYLNFAIYLLNP